MTFPSIFDWLNLFSFWRGYPAGALIAVTAVLIVLFLDWRLSLLALAIQYMAVSLLAFDLLEPHLAIIKLFVGMFVCLILYWTARQVDYGRWPENLFSGVRWRDTQNLLQLGPVALPRTLALRVLAAALALLLVAALVLLFSFRLPGMPEDLPYINLAALLLMALGVAGIISGGAPLPTGMAVLTFLSGFELYYAALDQSTRTLALLAALNLAAALVIAYWMQRRYMAIAATLRHD